MLTQKTLRAPLNFAQAENPKITNQNTETIWKQHKHAVALGEHMPLSLRMFWERFLAKITENEESSTGPTGAWVVDFWVAFILNYSSFTRPYLLEVWLALTRNHTILLKQCLALINHVSSNRSQAAHVREPWVACTSCNQICTTLMSYL